VRGARRGHRARSHPARRDDDDQPRHRPVHAARGDDALHRLGHLARARGRRRTGDEAVLPRRRHPARARRLRAGLHHPLLIATGATPVNLASMLKRRAAEGPPVRVGLAGAGTFGSMFLSQVRTTVGLHLMAEADLSAERARKAMTNTGWDVDAVAAASFADALAKGGTHLTEDSEALIKADGLDVVIDATGNPGAGIRHALLAARNGRHMVMVNVEADVLAGAYLAEEFRKAGLVYTLAYGDQPALVCEMVDW